MQELSGFFAPLVSPFTDDSSTLSEIRFARQMKQLNAANVAGFVVGGDVGEFTSLSATERKSLTEWTLREAAGKPVLVHVTSMSTLATLDLAQHAARHGARAVILMPPIYGSYTVDEVTTYLRIVGQHAGVPVVVVDPMEHISDEIHEELQQVPGIHFAISLVDAGFERLCASKGGTCPDEFCIGSAIVTPLALLLPERLGADAIHQDFAKLLILLGTLNPARIAKAALEAMGQEMGPPRGPLKPLTGPVALALRGLVAQ